MVTNPHTGKEVNVEPFLYFFYDQEFRLKSNLSERLGHAFRAVHLEMTYHSGSDWLPELTLLNDLVTAAVESNSNMFLED